ncbi:uncharacterized protein F5891DRAFT_1277636 [Suillus fuscotomentosus]|uniref:Uncharacterized protein n=1 Tax=Suillus fuscotomentosus TaxID=1912939 RepID=A0AAD4HM50_9AGAM|nr:uncharacterized protein F5891DRAFT_1277636 [Suillus fuscotomentosus]KAG1901256.1 hypothetical protein F5891DRAFT_1277636 [Suillus fuscotomentosus]
MLTVISASQPNRAGRLFVYTVTLSTSLERSVRRWFKGSLAIFKTPLNATIFIAIVFIQLALNAYRYFKKHNCQMKNTNRSLHTQTDSERLEADISVNEGNRENPLDDGICRNISSSLELQLSAVSLASCIAPLTREDSNVHLDSATSTRTRHISRFVSHIKLYTASDEPVHCHDKKIRKINSEYRMSETQEEVLVQDSSRRRILRVSNQPLVRQVTRAVSSVFCTPLRLPKNTATVTVACYTPESVERPISDVVTFTYPPYPISKVTNSNERKWPWQTRGLCIKA